MSGGWSWSVGKALRSGGRRREGRVTGFREAESVRAEGRAGAGPEVASAFACKEQSGEGRGSDDTGPFKSLERLGFS